MQKVRYHGTDDTGDVQLTLTDNASGVVYYLVRWDDEPKSNNVRADLYIKDQLVFLNTATAIAKIGD